jgi:hypothetical protein
MKMFVTSLALCGTAVYLYLIAGAQWECSLFPWFGHQCHGPQGDVWIFAFFFSVVGIPCTIWLLIIAVCEVVKGWR